MITQWQKTFDDRETQFACNQRTAHASQTSVYQRHLSYETVWLHWQLRAARHQENKRNGSARSAEIINCSARLVRTCHSVLRLQHHSLHASQTDVAEQTSAVRAELTGHLMMMMMVIIIIHAYMFLLKRTTQKSLLIDRQHDGKPESSDSNETYEVGNMVVIWGDESTKPSLNQNCGPLPHRTTLTSISCQLLVCRGFTTDNSSLSIFHKLGHGCRFKYQSAYVLQLSDQATKQFARPLYQSAAKAIGRDWKFRGLHLTVTRSTAEEQTVLYVNELFLSEPRTTSKTIKCGVTSFENHKAESVHSQPLTGLTMCDSTDQISL